MSWELMPGGANVRGADFLGGANVLVKTNVLVRANVLLGTDGRWFLPFFRQNPMRPKKGLYLVLVQKYRNYPKSQEKNSRIPKK